MEWTKFFSSISAGIPSFWYIPKRNKGSIRKIMSNRVAELPSAPFVRKYAGTPISAAIPKQVSCLRVSPNKSLLWILVRSFGACINMVIENPFIFFKQRLPQIQPRSDSLSDNAFFARCFSASAL